MLTPWLKTSLTWTINSKDINNFITLICAEERKYPLETASMALLKCSANWVKGCQGWNNLLNLILRRNSLQIGICQFVVIFSVICTGKSLSETSVLTSSNPQYDKRLFYGLPVQYMKTTSSEHVVYINCSKCHNKK